jgi:hypothetical protein
MEINERKKILYEWGALDCDIDALADYTANVFSPRAADSFDDAFLEKWREVFTAADTDGAAAAINRYLVKQEFTMKFISPEKITMELFSSAGGDIPVISAKNKADFEIMIRNIIYKGKEVPNIAEMGASFAFGKTNRFIILSDKPYSNVAAERMNLDENTWKEKSLIIRKYHECAHYYTKRLFGSSRNNLHDELIADFCGICAAFGEYRAENFLKIFGLPEYSGGIHGRIKVYTGGLSETAADIVANLAVIAANGVEEWSKTPKFAKMSESERIDYLCGKELLDYI